MAYALVGTAAPVVTGGGAPLNPTWGTGQNRTAGNLLVCWVAATISATTPTWSIPTPSGWIQAAYGVCSGGGAGNTPVVAIFYKIATGADAAPSFPNSTLVYYGQLAEFSGTVTNGDPRDLAAAASQGTGMSKSWTTTLPSTNVASGELVVTLNALDFNAISGTVTLTDSVNNASMVTALGIGTLTRAIFGYGFTTSNAAPIVDTGGWSTTVSGTSIGATSAVATFLLPGGPPRLAPQATAASKATALLTTGGTLSYVGHAEAAAATVNLPSGWQVGDLAVAYAYRNGSTAAPTVPSGWTQINAQTGANANSRAIGYRILQSGDTSTGTWTNATAIAVTILRNPAVSPIGASAAGGSNNATLTMPALTLTKTDGTSWLLLFAGSKATDANTVTYPGSFDEGSTQAALNSALEPNQTAFAGGAYSASVNATQNRTDVIEILAGPVAVPAGLLPSQHHRRPAAVPARRDTRPSRAHF